MIDNTQTLAEIIANTQTRLYRQESYDPKRNAQQNLSGRTHFVDDDTLRYFGSRILSAREVFGGSCFLIIESSFIDYNKTQRGFRFALFDVFGDCIHRPDLENAFKTSDKARAAFWKWAESFDVFAYYAETLHARAARLAREAARLTLAAAAVREDQAEVVA